jgi:hypothetical protein
MQKTFTHTEKHHGCVIIVFVRDMSNVAYTLFDPQDGAQLKTIL